MNEAIEALRQLASKLGQTVEYLWPEYLRFIVWNAVSEIFAAGLMLIVGLFTYRTVNRKYPDWIFRDRYGATLPTWKPFGVGVLVLLSLVFIVSTCVNIPRIAFPAGSAIKQIMKGTK